MAAEAPRIGFTVGEPLPRGQIEAACFDAIEQGAATIEIGVDHRRFDGSRTVVLAAVVAIDPTSYRRTLQRVRRTASELVNAAPARLRFGAEDGRPAPAVPEARSLPSPARRAALWVRCFLRRLRGALVRRVTTERWSVGILATPLRELLSGAPPQVRWLPLPREQFWADPFALVTRDGVEVLCEGYDDARRRGFLVRVPLAEDGGVGTPRPLAVPDACHRSYPYVVVDGDRRYVVPEQYQARRVSLYELDGDALCERACLLAGIAAVDPTPFHHDGRWWLFLTDRDRDDNGELLLYHAETLAGPWRPHPLNPIVRDVRCARPAGTPFVLDGVLYRPGQDCANGYGSRIAIARVDALTPTAYRETVVAHVEPQGDRGRRGVHTLAVADGIVLVDGKDVVVDPRATLAPLLRGLRIARRDVRPPSRSSDVPCGFGPQGVTLRS